MALRTDYRNPEFKGKIKYSLSRIISTPLEAYQFTDVTTYLEEYDYIDATIINLTNSAINTLASNYSTWVGTVTPLKTDYLNYEHANKKNYLVSTQDDKKILTDWTSYSQTGDSYGAADINATNARMNTISDSLSSGYAQVQSALRTAGATHVDDLVTALNEMISYQQSLGYPIGVNEAKNNPTSYGMVSATEYNTYANNNIVLRNNMTNIKDALPGYNSSMDATVQSCSTAVSRTTSMVSEIQSGDSAASVYSVIDEVNSTDYSNVNQGWAMYDGFRDFKRGYIYDLEILLENYPV